MTAMTQDPNRRAADWKRQRDDEHALKRRLREQLHTAMGGEERGYDVRIVLYPRETVKRTP